MFHCLLLMTSLLAGQVEAPAADALKSDVRRLVRQLDAAQLAQREAAEAELLKRGPGILDLLPQPNDRQSAEVRQRLARVRQKLQQSAADNSVKSSTVTLHADAMPFKTVLAEFQRQSGNSIVDNRSHGEAPPDTGPNLKVNFDKMPFWQALDQMLDQAGLGVYPFAEKGEKALISVVALPSKGAAITPTRRVGHASYSGPFRFEPASIVARRELRPLPHGSLSVNVEIAWEPRLRIIGLSQSLADIKAVDEKGNPLPVASSEAQLDIPTSGESAAVEMNLPFQLPSRDVQKIASLKGKLQAMIPGKVETFRFDKLAAAKNVEKRIAGVTVTLEQVAKNNDAWEVRMLVHFDDAGDALASHRTWIFNNEAYLEDANGKQIKFDTFETTAQDKNEVGIAYLFNTDQPMDKLTFVYKTPGTIVSSGFAYELKGIELP
jgi:hypothetical protein